MLVLVRRLLAPACLTRPAQLRMARVQPEAGFQAAVGDLRQPNWHTAISHLDRGRSAAAIASRP